MYLSPKTLGGAAVGLLMEITSTRTDPILVYTLPNGLGIYRTQFRDCDVCDLAYSGPHLLWKGEQQPWGQELSAVSRETILRKGGADGQGHEPGAYGSGSELHPSGADPSGVP